MFFKRFLSHGSRLTRTYTTNYNNNKRQKLLRVYIIVVHNRIRILNTFARARARVCVCLFIMCASLSYRENIVVCLDNITILMAVIQIIVLYSEFELGDSRRRVLYGLFFFSFSFLKIF